MSLINSKGITSVISVSLLIIVTVAAVVGFQSWLKLYSSDIQISVEKQESSIENSPIYNVINEKLYYVNSQNTTVSVENIKIGNSEISINQNYSQGAHSIDLGDSLNNVSGNVEVVIETNKGIYTKNIFLEKTTSTPSFSWCYQETANTSNPSDGSCSLNYSGSYSWSSGWEDPQNATDGNRSTGSDMVSKPANFYMNYSKPASATNESKFVGTFDEDGSIPPYQTTNVSIPSSCWSEEIIQFRLEIRDHFFADGEDDFYCYNGSSWEILSESGFRADSFYEEAMRWRIKE